MAPIVAQHIVIVTFIIYREVSYSSYSAYNREVSSQKVLWNENPRVGFQHYHRRSWMRSSKFTPQIICSRSRQCNDPQYLQSFRLKRITLQIHKFTRAQSDDIVLSQSTQPLNMYSNTKTSNNRLNGESTKSQRLTQLSPSSASSVVPSHPQIQSHTTTVVVHDVPGD